MTRLLVILVLLASLVFGAYALTQANRYSVANTNPDPTVTQPSERLRRLGSWFGQRRERRERPATRASTRPAS